MPSDQDFRSQVDGLNRRVSQEQKAKAELAQQRDEALRLADELSTRLEAAGAEVAQIRSSARRSELRAHLASRAAEAQISPELIRDVAIGDDTTPEDLDRRVLEIAEAVDREVTGRLNARLGSARLPGPGGPPPDDEDHGPIYAAMTPEEVRASRLFE